VTLVSSSQLSGTVSASSAVLLSDRVRYTSMGRTADLHPNWLREQSREPGQVEETNRQRLYTPRDIDIDLAVTGCSVHGDHLRVEFSDGHVARIPTDFIELRLGWVVDEEEPPAPEPWTTPLDPFPYIDWNEIGWSVDDEDTDAVIEFLTAFYRHGYVVLRNTPTVEGTLRRITDRLGYIVGNNFGWIFDVRAEPNPTDLAYTSIELLAHTDQPYRQPVPGIQLLHCLRNEAPGGDSTLVDGLAAANALLAEHPELHAALVETEVEWRYDMGTDTVVNRGHTLEYDRHGRYRQIRYNTKLDNPVLTPGADLDGYYAGRRWLIEWLNDPAHQVTFRLEPGDVMFMDNHRALHGRTQFDSSQGHRHLQGGYIDHDGPDTMYRLAIRRRASLSA
jgi:gamma-butyrobetaine dioxygenase